MNRICLIATLTTAITIVAQELSPAFNLFRLLDEDRNRTLSAAEWGRILQPADFTKVDADKDGKVSPFEWRDFIRPSGGGGRLGGSSRPGGDGGPTVGQPAPALKLKALKNNQLVDLTQVRRPTVLVFGSYT
ncbi:MAG: EF-hand domain-containing protein [Verrucomicrobiota bacterium]|nr:EF-hand domain-containing protein [Verrucomicrobiota bacterium]